MVNIENIRNRKKDLKLTTSELAYLAEVPTSTVSKIMTGETKNPSYFTIEKIENALDKVEMQLRIEAYIHELAKYIAVHPNEVFDHSEFERIYREKFNLGETSIPSATSQELYTFIKGNLALKKESKVSISVLHKENTDRWTELLDGVVIRNETPNRRHQEIVQALGFEFRCFIRENNGNCKVYDAGINVQIDEDEFSNLIPDIALVCDDSKLTEFGIWGAPDLVIEVVSPSSRKNDYRKKLYKYMNAGVREYWIVDPEKEKITVYLDGEPMMAYVYGFGDEIPVFIYDNALKLIIN